MDASRALRIVVFAMALAGVAYGEECASCKAPTFPEAQDFLAGKGYSEDAYTVLLAWSEAARYRAGVHVTGYHVLSKNDGTTFDLYGDANGQLLSQRELLALGIGAKHWELPPVEQREEIPSALAKVLPARPVPSSTEPAVAPSEAVVLDGVDVAGLEAEDAAGADDTGGAKSGRRIGIVRDLPEPIHLEDATASTGGWRMASDGSRVWAVTIESPGAHAMRLHFTELSVPSGCRLIVYNAYNPLEAYGPFERFYPGDTELWSDSCFSDRVVAECTVPEGVSSDGLCATIQDVVHTYKDFDALPWAKSGSCNQDVSCFDDWADTAKGIGAFAFVSASTQLHCTGTLIADSYAGSDIPYFLTANHCVSMQGGSGGASSMEFYWLFQTPSCDGTAPALSSVPRTSGGADLLATVDVSVGSDFALVRLRNTPPSGLTYVGWTTDVPAVGTELVAIHHPSGDHKRISFGTESNAGSPGAGNVPIKPFDRYHECLWHLGTTEPGSSGSPLMLADSHLIIGQLWGGSASCYRPAEPDYFGRFDVTYPLVSAWLTPSETPLDVDASGDVTVTDVQLVVNALLGISLRYNADVDVSGTVDSTDLQLVIIALLGGAS